MPHAFRCERNARAPQVLPLRQRPWIWMLHWTLPLILQTPCFYSGCFLLKIFGAYSVLTATQKKKSKETVMSYQRSHVKPASQRWAKRYSRMRCPILMVGWYISVHQVVIQLNIYTSETGSPTNLFRLWGRQGLSQSSELYAGIYLYIYLISRFVCTYIYIHNHHIYYILY